MGDWFILAALIVSVIGGAIGYIAEALGIIPSREAQAAAKARAAAEKKRQAILQQPERIKRFADQLERGEQINELLTLDDEKALEKELMRRRMRKMWPEESIGTANTSSPDKSRSR